MTSVGSEKVATACLAAAHIRNILHPFQRSIIVERCNKMIHFKDYSIIINNFNNKILFFSESGIPLALLTPPTKKAMQQTLISMETSFMAATIVSTQWLSPRGTSDHDWKGIFMYRSWNIPIGPVNAVLNCSSRSSWKERY